MCAFGIQSCIIAEQAGAIRVELCDNPIEGGTTPSYGTIKKVRQKISIALFPIIRPRSMNYFYDEEEWNIVLEDVSMCKELGCDGVSVGVQKINGTIDGDKMKMLVEKAYPMQVTCNRAFDAVPDPFAALQVLMEAGCVRVLTSGLAAAAPEGADLLQQLVAMAGDRMRIMPGAGVRSTNLLALMQKTGAREFHSSARKKVINPMQFSNPMVSDAGNMFVAEAAEIEKMVQILNSQP